MDKFWRWVTNEVAEMPVRTLHLEGYIAESSWFDDDITPKQFKTELYGSGGVADLQVGINLLSEVKESIINAYQTKSGLSRSKISHMMDAETWMSAHKAIEMKFADKILYESDPVDENASGFIFDQMTVTNALRNKLPGIQARMKYITDKKEEAGIKQSTDISLDENKTPDSKVNIDNQIPITQLQKRLELIKNWR